MRPSNNWAKKNFSLIPTPSKTYHIKLTITLTKAIKLTKAVKLHKAVKLNKAIKLTKAYPQQGVSPCVHYYEPSTGTSNIPQERPLVWSTKIFPTWPAQCLQAAEVTLDTAGEKKQYARILQKKANVKTGIGLINIISLNLK